MSGGNFVHLDPGGHVLPGRFSDPDVRFGPDDLLVHLVGELTNLELTGAIPAMHRPATTVEIRMDQRAAMMLASRILDLARTMGWPRLPGG